MKNSDFAIFVKKMKIVQKLKKIYFQNEMRNQNTFEKIDNELTNNVFQIFQLHCYKKYMLIFIIVLLL